MRPRALVLVWCAAAAGCLAPVAHAVPARDTAAKPAPGRADTPTPGKASTSTPGKKRTPLVGFADQKASMFADPRFVALGTRHARINVPWDVLREPSTLANLDAWMAGARLRGIAPLFTVDRSRRPGMQSRNPSPRVMTTQVRKWRKRWPGQVNQISSWNEGNINKRPELVAQWYLAIRKACPSCTVLGADIVDRKNAVSWAKRFVKAAKRSPAVWGFHNYIDANTFKTTNTRAFLRAVKGRVWLTETGGVVRRSRVSVKFAGKGPNHAAKATDYLFKKIVSLDRKRIERVYLYQWGAGSSDDTWDSGFIGPDGKERPALRLVRCYLGSCKAKAPATAAPATADGAKPAG